MPLSDQNHRPISTQEQLQLLVYEASDTMDYVSDLLTNAADLGINDELRNIADSLATVIEECELVLDDLRRAE